MSESLPGGRYLNIPPFGRAWEGFQQFLVVELPIPPIHLRNLTLQVGQVAFRETAHNVEPLNATLGLGLGKLQDGVDAFLLCVVDEAAGIDDHNLTLGVIAIMGTMEAVGLHQPHQHLAVNEILRASQ